MATTHSYGATLKNNRTENQALSFLLTSDKNFVALTKDERKHVLSLLGLDKSFTRAFDLVLRKDGGVKGVLEMTKDEIILVELKTTQKNLPDNPKGFFFGATENEFKLARKLDNKYKFCFVSLHPESLSYKLLTLSELEPLIRTNRTQYQINL